MSDSQNVEIILTFDDGPDNGSGSANKTQRVLNTLANNSVANGIRSVFFIQSHARNDQNNHFRGMSANGRIAATAALNAGHLVQIHTGADIKKAHSLQNTHPKRLKAGELVNDLRRCKQFIRDLTNPSHNVRYVRPTYGDWSDPGFNCLPTYTNEGLKMIYWDIDSGDTGKTNNQHNTVEDVRRILYNAVCDSVEGGATNLIILFHDLDPQTYPHLEGHIEKIDEAVRDENKTPIWLLSEARIREIFEAKNYVSNDPNH